MPTAPSLSVVIITYNEEKNIGRCLNSVRDVADEIVVLDSFSTDNTAKMCAEYGVRFHQHAFDGHIEQKNRALGLASSDWILALDADEALSYELIKAILVEKNRGFSRALSMNRLSNYCGSWIKHGSWYPDTKLRLWNRNWGKWGGLNPHDEVVLHASAEKKHLQADILHYSYYTHFEHVERSIKYAKIAAFAMKKAGKNSGIVNILFSPVIRFIRDYFLKAGFRDGFNGFFIASISAYTTFLKYCLRYIDQKKQAP
jgi:glycosyltransferase involved in cell wall biosynthesis